MARVLVVEDVRTQALFLRRVLEADGHEVISVRDVSAALTELFHGGIELVISDLRLEQQGDGIDLFRRAREQLAAAAPSFVILTAHGTVEAAREALLAGVYDFLTKPVDPTELSVIVKNAIEFRRLREENRALTQAVAVQKVRERLIGNSRAFGAVIELAQAAAESEATILVRGESGTGKELIAELIHAASPRAAGPLVKVNCGAIPENLLEAELFGHEKGAYTDAHQARAGRFELAHGGTIFLDEVAEMSPALQVKLLRVLQERELERLGGQGQVIPLDVRLVAATNRDLEALIVDGRFREDLYYRINVITIQAPPLRERAGDVELLANHFCARFTEKNHKQFLRISAPAMEILRRHSWPGNVRELENVIERAVVLGRGEEILPSHLPDALLHAPRASAEDVLKTAIDHVFEDQIPLEDFSRQVIERAVQRHRGNITQAARVLGLTRRALQYRIDRDGINRPR
ncbi:MAG: sigma-54-dependent transcriptional regulator [Planctomycetota bacterium]